VGHERSFERLYRRHRRAVYGSVLRDVRDPDEAEDVTQVAFLNAFRALSRGDEPERPRAWLLMIARNVVRRRARLRASRPQEVELDPDIALALDDVESSTADDICDALRRLPENQRHAVTLREIQGRSYAEIAEAMDLSMAAVEALIFRARRALAAELEILERAPVVQRRTQRKRGLLALPLPGFARLGELGLSFGRAGAACAVGCTVMVTLPLGGTGAGKAVAAPETARPAAVAVARVSSASALPTERPAAAEKKKKSKAAGARTEREKADDDGPTKDAGTSGGSVAGIQVPQLPVAPVTVPQLPVEPPQLPPAPIELPPPPDLLQPLVTS
jgi:RNA polymerase sigma-70 factor (ECF subfamily)